ncbi:MAG: hypothetical protein WCI73_00565 [Phycisphaerae bacterium]
MSNDFDYPRTAAEVLTEPMVFPPAVLRAVKKAARTKMWQGDLEARRAKLQQLNRDLGEAYGVEPPLLVFEGNGVGCSGASTYSPSSNMITMRGRTSLITFYHEWCHRLYGRSERKAVQVSLLLFKEAFPKSWSRLRFHGHMARRDDLVGS